MRAEKAKKIGGADADGDAFDHAQPNAAVASEQNNCGNGNPTSFFGVEEAPGTDHVPLRIAENWKRQFVLAPHPLRLLRGIYGQRGNVNTEGAEVIGEVAKFRQLTETKRSPVATIEDEQKWSIGQQRRKGAGRAGGVGQCKILGKRTDLRVLEFVQARQILPPRPDDAASESLHGNSRFLARLRCAQNDKGLWTGA